MSSKLPEALARLVVADLKELAGQLPCVDTNGRKEELIARIVAALMGEGLKAIWSGLDSVQRAAVAEAVHHPLGEYSDQRFRAKYQQVPAFSEASGKPPGSRGSKKSALCLFIHYSPDDRRSFVPVDLRTRLKAFVPVPAPVVVNSAESLAVVDGLTIRLTEREALQEFQVMLRTIEQERIQVSEKTALPSTAALRLLTEKLVGGDFFPWVAKKNAWEQEIGPIKAFAWPLLLQAGGLAARSAGRLILSPTGVKALSASPADGVRGLWRKWQKTTLVDEFNRIDDIKGQYAKGRVMTAAAPRRQTIEAALQACPVGRWIAFDDFSRYLRAADHLFAVTHDPWKLYLVDRQYGSLGYDGFGGWNILQDRYMMALLFEYAATLGIVDIAYVDPADARSDFRRLWGADDLAYLSRYDGIQHFRLTALGAYVLGLEANYQPVIVPCNVTLSVMPSLLVNVVTGELGPENGLRMENWATQIEPGSWRLDREKALSAIEKGHDLAAFKQFLEAHDDMPLPEPVDALFRHCARYGKALKLTGQAVLIECRDQETADAIGSHKETASLCLRAGTKSLVVRNDHLEKFRERIRLLGFGMPV